MGSERRTKRAERLVLAVAMMLGVQQATGSWVWAALALVVAVWFMMRAERKDAEDNRARQRHKEILRSDIATLILEGKKLQSLLGSGDAELEQTPAELYADWVREVVCYFRSNLPSEVVGLTLEVPAWMSVRVAAKPDRAEVIQTLGHRLARLHDLHDRIPSLDLEPPLRAR